MHTEKYTSLRPKPLGDGFFAFLSPKVPLVPDLPEDVQDAGRNVETDARLFPADEELTQRILVDRPADLYRLERSCVGWCPPIIPHQCPMLGSVRRTDLYLWRILRRIRPLASSAAPTSRRPRNHDHDRLRLFKLDATRTRAVVDGKDLKGNARIRIIILTALLIALGLIPALWKLLHEFNTVANYRKRWMKVKCANNEMGWLSASKAPGFVGWGEKRLKSYLLKTGLSSKLESGGESRREKKDRERRLTQRESG
jgi:hypothetical protein